MNQKLHDTQRINRQIRALTDVYQNAIGGGEISLNEFWIWYSLLVEKGEYSQQDLCNAWTLPKQTVNTIVARLVQKELITLEALPCTRNRKILRLTEAGKIYGRTVILPILQAEQRAYARLSHEDRLVFSAILERYVDALRQEMQQDNSKEERNE